MASPEELEAAKLARGWQVCPGPGWSGCGDLFDPHPRDGEGQPYDVTWQRCPSCEGRVQTALYWEFASPRAMAEAALASALALTMEATAATYPDGGRGD